MKPALVFGFGCLLAGCTDWNEQVSEFSDYQQFKAGKYGNSGHLPDTLIPPSARAIHVVYNIDSTEIEARFTFASADAERVIGPFRSPDQIRIRELEREGSLPPSKVKSPLFIRCRERVAEFLQVTDM